MLFDRIAVTLVTAWFLAGLWLVVQAARLPGARPAAGDADGD